MKRYEVYWVYFDPTQGSEMAKRRPAVIVSRDELNRILPTLTVCPLTSTIHPTWRTRLQIVLEGKPAEIAGDQIRTVSTSRVGERIGTLETGEATRLRALFTELYGD
jgi:mRNA interferase MazF